MKKYVAMPASGGLSVAKIKIINRRISGFKRVVLTPAREKALFNAAVVSATDEINQLIENCTGAHRDILTFQVLVMADEGLKNIIDEYINQGLGAAKATENAMEEYCQKLKDIGDDYLSQRTGDIRDALTRVIDILDGRPREKFILTENCIVVADEILPSDLAVMDRKFMKGFITSGGSYQNHANIIARTMGIPSVCGCDREILNPLNQGKTVALDGYTGEVFLSPNDGTIALFNHKISLEKRDSLHTKELRDAKVYTKDKERVYIYANCSDPQDVALAVNNGADGIGLVRSEVIFMSSNYDLSLASQIRFYTECIRAAKGKEITIRTFDIGADKPLDSLKAEKEPNPALGMRGIRLMYSHREFFKRQIEALYVSADRCGKINVMLPMVSVVKDVEDFMVLAKEVKERIMKEGIITQDNINWGIMIETPSAAIISDELAPLVSFFSIGTNDLTQYTLAADRINTNAAMYYNPTHPSVVKLIELTVKNAKKYGVKVSVCGESASDFESAKIYIEKGVRYLSMASGAMFAIKERLIEEFSENQ